MIGTEPSRRLGIVDIIVCKGRARIVAAPDADAIVIGAAALRRIKPHEVDGFDGIAAADISEIARAALIQCHGVAVSIVVVGTVKARCRRRVVIDFIVIRNGVI